MSEDVVLKLQIFIELYKKITTMFWFEFEIFFVSLTHEINDDI